VLDYASPLKNVIIELESGDDPNGKVMGYVTYDDWGALTAKAMLNCRERQLDLVQDYTGHPYDQVLAV